VTTACLSALLALVGSPLAAGGAPASATLPNGAVVAFSVLRTGPGVETASALGESVLESRGENALTRVLQDPASGAYFGYRVGIERKGDSAYVVTFGALDPRRVERSLRRGRGAQGPEPHLVAGASPRFPAPQQIAMGEALTLELLANPNTGERIYDVIKVSDAPISSAALQAAVARAREGQTAGRRAAAHVARGRYFEAAAEYRRALEIQPRDAVLHNRLGICYQHLGNDAMARHEYRAALDLNPSYAEVWNNLGTLEQQQKRLPEAVKAYRRSIRLKRELATPWKNLGNAYLALERPEEAFEAYQEAFRLDPTIVESEGAGIPAGVDAATQGFYLAKLLAQHGLIDASLDLLRRARDAGFDDFERVKSDPDFAAVVADPRFADLLGE